MERPEYAALVEAAMAAPDRIVKVREAFGMYGSVMNAPKVAADDYIVARLEQLPQEPVILVTNDKELQERGRELAATIAVADAHAATVRAEIGFKKVGDNAGQQRPEDHCGEGIAGSLHSERRRPSRRGPHQRSVRDRCRMDVRAGSGRAHAGQRWQAPVHRSRRRRRSRRTRIGSRTVARRRCRTSRR